MNAAPMFVVSLTAFMRAAQAPSPSEAHLVQISALCCCCDTLRWLRSLHRGSEPQCRPHERSKQKVGVVLVEKSRGRRCQQRTPSRPSRSLPRCPAAAHINTPNNSHSTAQRSLLLTLSLICAMADQHADLVDVANDDHNPTSSTTSSTTTDAAALDVDKLSRSLEAQLAGEEEFTIKEDMSVRCSPCALGLRSLLRLTERGGWRRSSRRSTLPTWRTRRCS